LGHAVQLELEPGRYLVAESVVLVSEVRATKNMGRNHFILLDAGFTELMRPAMYGSYHGMSLIQRDGTPVLTQIQSTVVGGPLCESGDVFTQAEGGVLLKRELPQAKVGNYLVIEDAGAYGASMSSNYNSRPLAPEVLMEEGRARLIRRRQNLEDLLSLERV
jgi:diaminopimelate decarboxylase